ncbi:hypothetical protein [Pontibacter ruber]|uniref:Lipoprotein n=1 Tax=Pontibacter ruber TaxID=1343895 RepID=A0ABW5CTF7_9BACT|nr:hypothetical protein [Pontibacter ruber]
MKPLKLYFAALLALTLTAFSCDKEDDLEVQEATATLYWTGDYAVDGCGFVIYIDEKKYKPKNEGDIDAAFKKEEPMTVEVKYVLPGKQAEYVCGMARRQAESIIVLSVKEIK